LLIFHTDIIMSTTSFSNSMPTSTSTKKATTTPNFVKGFKPFPKYHNQQQTPQSSQQNSTNTTDIASQNNNSTTSNTTKSNSNMQSYAQRNATNVAFRSQSLNNVSLEKNNTYQNGRFKNINYTSKKFAGNYQNGYKYHNPRFNRSYQYNNNTQENFDYNNQKSESYYNDGNNNKYSKQEETTENEYMPSDCKYVFIHCPICSMLIKTFIDQPIDENCYGCKANFMIFFEQKLGDQLCSVSLNILSATRDIAIAKLKEGELYPPGYYHNNNKTRRYKELS
jgi:hypothetical protein